MRVRSRIHDRRMIRAYDRGMVDPIQNEFYGQSGFCNYGYSTKETQNQLEACENLMERLLSFIPEKKGSILDVACGLGATTRHLLKYYPAEMVSGINISEFQISIARQNAPGTNLQQMNATALDFPDASFDAVICVEAAMHFQTREKFLREALRVLKPGGYLVLSDILALEGRKGTPNFVSSPEAYEQLLTKVGFTNLKVEDATEPSAMRFAERRRKWPVRERKAGRLRKGFFSAWIRGVGVAIYVRRFTRYYLLAAAQKP